jgi:hypothetical protein
MDEIDLPGEPGDEIGSGTPPSERVGSPEAAAGRPMSPFSVPVDEALLEVELDTGAIGEISRKQAEIITASAFQQAALLQDTFAKLATNDMALASQLAIAKQKIRTNQDDALAGVQGNAAMIEELRGMVGRLEAEAANKDDSGMQSMADTLRALGARQDASEKRHQVICASPARAWRDTASSGALRAINANPARALRGRRRRVRLHCRFAVPLIQFIPDLLSDTVPLFLKRQCDRTLHRRRWTGSARSWCGSGRIARLGRCGPRRSSTRRSGGSRSSRARRRSVPSHHRVGMRHYWPSAIR